ncbi:nucleoside-diphosphate kinase [Blattabacterium cuenoti]|uniref:nucleoside-diphosphate kinase n=1 Tax=Blattabacterium cuenoti TaxID=1653831 RepID=UPI00163C79C1|nr:nucleoside-diphosphate kinase [Blattabacterium cuenoti]
MINYFGKITLSIIKPDAVKNGYICPILIKTFNAGFNVKLIKTVKISKNLISKFYEEHRKKYFFNSLIKFMSSGIIVPMVLEKNNAVKDFRNLIGNTDPIIAKKGTIRNLYATSLEKNAIHGSDSNIKAIKECIFFFPNIINNIIKS